MAEIDVCNFALCLLQGAINTDVPLLASWDEEETSQTALPTLRFFKACYPRAIRKMQSRWPFPECERFPILGAALDSASAVDVPDWDYVYNKPSDCIAFWGVVSNDIDLNNGEWTEYPFYEAGGQIACNVTNSDDDDPGYRFHVNVLVENTGLWSEELFQVTAHLLAMYTCRPLGGTMENQALIKGLYDNAWSEAKAAIQARKFQVTRRSQTGDSVEVAPGIVDYKFPQPC